MSTSWSPRNFDVIRRGYAPQQVDETFAALVRDLTTLRDQRDAIQRQLAEAQSQLGQVVADTEQQPTYRGIGDRIERILRLAEEEAEVLRKTTATEIDRDRGLADQQIDRIREQADLYAKERRAQADAEAGSIVESARREADALREDAERTSRVRKDEAENLFELNRGKAAQAAADFEITLSHRRDQAERDFANRMETLESQLVANEERSEALRFEAEELRTTSERKAAQVLDAARVQAEELVREAALRATRTRSETERELASMVQRRDSINLQLTNVRQMLATLTGSAPPIDPLAAHGEPEVIASVETEDEPDDLATEDSLTDDIPTDDTDESGDESADAASVQADTEASADEDGESDEASADATDQDAEDDAQSAKEPAAPPAASATDATQVIRTQPRAR